MRSHRDELDLAAELKALRPAPRPAFIAELDARSAAGFPVPSGKSEPWRSRVAEALRASSPRRLVAPAGVAALTAVVIATAAVAISEEGRGPSADRPRAAAIEARPAPPTQFSAPPADRPGEAVTQAAQGLSASGAGARRVERSTQLVLATEPSELRATVAKVLSVVHSHDGIVMRSSIRDREGSGATAAFQLLIPNGKLADALASFSAVAELRARSDSTADVTGPTLGLRERLADARARVDGLLAQLARADTDAERASAEAELRSERRRVAALRSRLTAIRQRSHFARVSLRIESAATSAAQGWGVGEAIDDAGRILGIAAGVSVIVAAVLAPLALIILLAALAHRIWVRRAREGALG